MTKKVKAALEARNQSELARYFGISRSAVHQWKRKVPQARVFEVKALLGLELHEIRPDVYPAPERETA